MSQFLELPSWRCVHRDDASNSDYVASSGCKISDWWIAKCGRSVFSWFKAPSRGFRKRTEKNNEKHPESVVIRGRMSTGELENFLKQVTSRTVWSLSIFQAASSPKARCVPTVVTGPSTSSPITHKMFQPSHCCISSAVLLRSVSSDE
jgi:hypothetical protein